MERALSPRARLDGRSEPSPLASSSVFRRFSEFLELGPGVGDLISMCWTSSAGDMANSLTLDLGFILRPRKKKNKYYPLIEAICSRGGPNGRNISPAWNKVMS